MENCDTGHQLFKQAGGPGFCSRSTQCFDSDPVSTFHFNADPDLDLDPYPPSFTHGGKSETNFDFCS
jgi:hypothetical protein